MREWESSGYFSSIFNFNSFGKSLISIYKSTYQFMIFFKSGAINVTLIFLSYASMTVSFINSLE
jgi:hypothetical protein